VVGQPIVSKAFSPTAIDLGGVSTVVITIDNRAQPTAATGLAFTDTLPAGMTVASPANASTDCVAGMVTAVEGAGSFSLAAGTVAAGAVCTVMVDVTVTPFGSFPNTVAVTSNLGASAPAMAVLEVAGNVIEIPTAGTWGLLLLASLLAVGALWRLRG